MVTKPIFGNWISVDRIEDLSNSFIFSMKEPWEIISPKLSKNHYVNYNFRMDLDHLENLYNKLKDKLSLSSSIIGLGGGTSCDTAKYFVWKLNQDLNLEIDLYLIPSIISVDAFLCSSIAVRINGKVNYIGESEPREIIIDFDLIKKAPAYLNRAGISDTISIVSALGDWKIARDENNEHFDQNVFEKAKGIASKLMEQRENIMEVNKIGIKALVDGFYEEVSLCEEYGNARPEEGSEHFLAYCLESISKQHYIHGNLIGMNIIISLFLQEEYAEFSMEDIKHFLNDIRLKWTLKAQKIEENLLKNAFKIIKNYVRSENFLYSIYNSPRLNIDQKMIDSILKIIK